MHLAQPQNVLLSDLFQDSKAVKSISNRDLGTQKVWFEISLPEPLAHVIESCAVMKYFSSFGSILILWIDLLEVLNACKREGVLLQAPDQASGGPASKLVCTARGFCFSV